MTNGINGASFPLDSYLSSSIIVDGIQCLRVVVYQTNAPFAGESFCFSTNPFSSAPLPEWIT